MSDHAIAARRSTHSLRFEKALRAAAMPGVMARLSDIDLGDIGDLAAWIAIVDPAQETHSLKFSHAGAGVSRFLGRDAAGLDYLDFVDPAITGDAFDSAFLMLSRPCGLWQITPALTDCGATLDLEYTGYPVFDDARGRGQIMALIRHPAAQAPRVAMVRHATQWCWLDMR